jgi:hypothetical protein
MLIYNHDKKQYNFVRYELNKEAKKYQLSPVSYAMLEA